MRSKIHIERTSTRRLGRSVFLRDLATVSPFALLVTRPLQCLSQRLLAVRHLLNLSQIQCLPWSGIRSTPPLPEGTLQLTRRLRCTRFRNTICMCARITRAA